MSYLDIILCIPLIWGLYKGFTKGLVIQVASLLALVLGVYGAVLFSGLTQELLEANFQIDNKYLPLIAFVATFVAIVVAVHFLGKVLEKTIDIIALGLFNKIFGAVFGFLKAALILSVLVFVLELIDAQLSVIPQKEKNKSILYGPMGELIPTIVPDAKKLVRRTSKEILV
ncbi:MAG: CvpA family protein [Flavobacteriales bacterium]|nr:CvpA family protein [Flavobacteriales bacterium]